MKSPRSQRGVALITAVLIVALATILAVNVQFRGFLDQRRAATLFAMDQAFEVAKGAEAWAADILREDAAAGSKEDHYAERWATPIPPLTIGDDRGEVGHVEGQLYDMQGRFNLNTLVTYSEQNNQIVRNELAVAHFARLLELVGLETKWAGMIADWIDPDIDPGDLDGAEDSVYTMQTPPYRAANMPITRATELLSMPGFGIEQFRRIEPHVTALPMSVTTINVCTATPEVLDSMTRQEEWIRAREQLTKIRAEGCEPRQQTFAQIVGNDHEDARARSYYTELLTETSNYFEASIWVSIGTTHFTLYSVLYRNGNTVGPLLRSFGTR
jgi:general secretion pathway protein K